MAIVRSDRRCENVVGFTGGGSTNTGFVFVTLKPLARAPGLGDQVIARLRRKLGRVAGATLFLQAVAGPPRRRPAEQRRSTSTRCRPTALRRALRLDAQAARAALEERSRAADVNSDQQNKGLETDLVIDRATAARLGVTPDQIDNTLYDAFGQRQVSTIYNAAEPVPRGHGGRAAVLAEPETLKDIYVSTSGAPAARHRSRTGFVAGTVGQLHRRASRPHRSPPTRRATPPLNAHRHHRPRPAPRPARAVSTRQETMVPLSAFTHYGPATRRSPSTTRACSSPRRSPSISPRANRSSDASAAIRQAMRKIGMPATIHGSFAGTAQAFQQSLANEPLLILAALVAVYIVLGILYESYIHPITILSTCPRPASARVLALMLFTHASSASSR